MEEFDPSPWVVLMVAKADAAYILFLAATSVDDGAADNGHPCHGV